jgi:hypothetical protein
VERPFPTPWGVGLLSARAAAADLRCLVSERRVRERLKRLVQARELGGDAEQGLLRVEPAVQRPKLVADPVQSAEERVELPVFQRC